MSAPDALTRVIGLTGGIACGKTTIANALRERGYTVLDADAASHALTAPGGAGLAPIRAEFGDAYFLPDGSLDRKRLGALIFGDETARKRLNALLHPLIYAALDAQRAQALAAGAHIVFEDIPLLFETGAEGGMDQVWAVYCAPEIQMQRLMRRDDLTEQEARQRIGSQMSAREKAERADAVIDTTNGLESALEQLDALLQKTEQERVN